MKTRDFINIGIFSAIYFVLVFGTGMLGIINPAMMFVGYALGLIANGAVVMLFKSRVPKIGALALMGLLVGSNYRAPLDCCPACTCAGISRRLPLR